MIFNRFQSIHTAGAAITVAYLALCGNSRHYGNLSLAEMLMIMGAIHFVWLFYTLREPVNDKPTHSVTAVLMWALIFRLIGLATYPPLEEDIFRYLWDGYSNAELGGAYRSTPGLFYGTERHPEAMIPILDRISYPDVSTVYGPVVQALFTIAYWISPGSIVALKSLLMCFDLGLIALLSRVLTTRQLLLISWCPLMVYQFSVSAHIEIVSIGLLMAAFIAHFQANRFTDKHKTADKTREIGIPVLLALAVASKVTAIILVPFLLMHRWRRVPVFLLSLAILYALAYGLFSGLPLGLLAMGKDWQFNAFIYSIVQSFTDSTTAKLIVLILFVILYFLILLSIRAWDKRSYLACEQEVMARAMMFTMTAFLLLSPVLNAWYWAWVLVFTAFVSDRWPWWAGGLLFISYCTGLNLGITPNTLGLYEIPIFLFYFQHITILILICFHLTGAFNAQRQDVEDAKTAESERYHPRAQ